MNRAMIYFYMALYKRAFLQVDLRKVMKAGAAESNGDDVQKVKCTGGKVIALKLKVLTRRWLRSWLQPVWGSSEGASACIQRY